MAIITLTTDFGIIDHRVASIKGQILGIKSGIPIVDISHDIEPHNLLHTAYIVKNAYRHFPKGSIHIITVDSHYHRERKFLVCKVEEHFFIMADNGILSLMFPNIKLDTIHEISHNDHSENKVMFTPTDLFVPIAIQLYKGENLKKIGKKITEIKESVFPKPNYNENQNMLVGEIIYIDHFGNAVSNIDKETFNKYAEKHEKFRIKFRSISIKKIVEKYTDIIPNWEEESRYHGKELTLFNEADLLEIALYKGNQNNGASSLMGLNIGEKVFIEFE